MTCIQMIIDSNKFSKEVVWYEEIIVVSTQISYTISIQEIILKRYTLFASRNYSITPIRKQIQISSNSSNIATNYHDTKRPCGRKTRSPFKWHYNQVQSTIFYICQVLYQVRNMTVVVHSFDFAIWLGTFHFKFSSEFSIFVILLSITGEIKSTFTRILKIREYIALMHSWSNPFLRFGYTLYPLSGL